MRADSLVENLVDSFFDESSDLHPLALNSTTLGRPCRLAPFQQALKSFRCCLYPTALRQQLCVAFPFSSFVPLPWHSHAVGPPRSHSVGHQPKMLTGALRFGRSVYAMRPRRLSSSNISARGILSAGIEKKVPVAIVTGFLGSGKTILFNHILTKSHGKRIAVIENEFGEIGIDHELVASANAGGSGNDSIILMNNGCLCCTVRGDLVEMLVDLTTTYRDKFDHIVIETTGLASVGPIIQTFYAEPQISTRVFIDGVVTLIDAKHITQHLDEGSKRVVGSVNQALEQIAYADRLVLNKIDLVSASDLLKIRSRLRAVNGMAVFSRMEKATIGVEYVLRIGGFDLGKVERSYSNPMDKHDNYDHDHRAHDHSIDDCRGCVTDDYHHSDRVSSISIEINDDLDFDKLNKWCDVLQGTIHADLYRFKGVVSVKDRHEKYVFHGVHSQFEGSPMGSWKPGVHRKSTMVLIGKDLPIATIRSGFMNCIADANDAVGKKFTDADAKQELAAEVRSLKGFAPDEMGQKLHRIVVESMGDEATLGVILKVISDDLPEAMGAMLPETIRLMDKIFLAGC